MAKFRSASIDPSNFKTEKGGDKSPRRIRRKIIHTHAPFVADSSFAIHIMHHGSVPAHQRAGEYEVLHTLSSIDNFQKSG